MQRVDFTGLSKTCFARMIEQMLLSLNNFASHGRGWWQIALRMLNYDLSSQNQFVPLPI